MEQLQGTRLLSFPYSELNKVCDLIEFDGPLLSHYQNASKSNFLFYWIDNDYDVNRWMLIEVNDDDFADYLHCLTPLKSLILSNASVIITHINRDMSYTETVFVAKDQIPSSYLPDDDSFFTFDIPAQYGEEHVSKNDYLNILREGASVYRLRPRNHTFNHAVKARDAGKFLTNLTNSASVYTTYEFYNNFKDSITDPQKLKSTLLSVKKATELLVIDTQFRSFEVTLSIDTVMGMEEGLKGYKEWRKSVLKNYYKDVIDIDHSSQACINTLQEKFPEEDLRKKIVKPIADILVDASFALETKSSVHNAPVLHKTINRTTYKKLIAPVISTDITEKVERKKIVSLIVEVTERDGKTIFGKKTLDEGIISQSDIGHATLSLNFLPYEQYEISFKKPIEYQYFIDDQNLNNIYCPVFNLSTSGQSKKEVMNNFWSTLGSFITESVKNQLNKELLDEYIEDISETF
jgi:hypothetical protein